MQKKENEKREHPKNVNTQRIINEKGKPKRVRKHGERKH